MYHERIEKFTNGIQAVSQSFKEIYHIMTRGGTGELEPLSKDVPFETGLTLVVRPPGKVWKKIQNLSDGEKTLVSLSFVFALHQYKPSPLYFMDDIEAVLDYKNVEMLARYIKERSLKCQFLIISLRNNMFQLADHPVGVYKKEETTKTVMMIPKKVEDKIHENYLHA
jgi:structural maintenance of chromosome 4